MADIDYRYYKGTDLYSDGDIEDVITEYIKQTTDGDYSSHLRYDSRWECFYHLSPIRENILNWYPFEPEASVLEIGGGFGAVTGLLCRKCASVTSVEPSKRRAEGLFARHSDRDNLNVIIGNLNDIEFDKKFDYITLIGVLEYACAFTDAPAPLDAFLEKLKCLLKPDGKLLIAIENRFGIKYWCGSNEEHTGRMFDGINGYEGINSVKTFGKAELTELLERNGFCSQNYYYPYPDHKLPRTIFTDNHLPTDSSINTNREFYLEANHFTANEKRILPEMTANGVFPFFSNSYFVEASQSELPENAVSFAMLSTDRMPVCAVGTTINSNGEVIKFPLSERAVPQIKSLGENYEYLKAHGINMIPQTLNGEYCVTPFIDLPTADDAACEMLSKGDRAGIIALFDELNNAVMSSSELTESPDGAPILEKAFIDMNLSNAFIKDGALAFYDQEWMLPETDARFVMYRAIVSFAGLSGDAKLCEELFARFGISDELKNKFAKADSAFLDSVNDYSAVDFLNSHTYSYNETLNTSTSIKDLHGALLEQCVRSQDATINALFASQGSFRRFLKSKAQIATRRLVPFRVRAGFKRLRASKLTEGYRYDKWMKNHKAVPVPKNTSVKFSILVPLYNTDKKFLIQMIESVKKQTYPNWELCLADASDASHRYVEAVARRFAERDERIKYARLTENLGISGNTNECRKMASGDYITLLDHDDLILSHALASVATEINKSSPDVIYSDEDKTDEKNHRHLPFFKPDFNRDLLYSQMYICHLLVFKSELFDKVGGLSDAHSGAQDYDLMLRFTEHTDKILHISDILYSWRETSTSTSVNPGSKPYAHDAGKAALDAHLKRVYGDYAHAEDSEYLFVYDARFDLLKNEPLVSIIMPTKNGADYVRRCVESILEKSTYKNFELLILDNNSDSADAFECFAELTKRDKRVRVIRAEFPFNWSKLNNFGIKHARGDVFIFLNNDMYVISPDWIERLAENALRPDVGAVGAMLLYDDGTIQHAGVVVGMNNWADHVFKGMPPEHYGHGFVSPVINRDVLAVTGACLACSRTALRKIGLFNEKFIVCGSDVEFCINAHKAGLSVMYNANVKLCHYESKSRDVTAIPKVDFMLSEIAYNEYRNGNDPFYNKNLDSFSTTPRIKI